MNAPDVSVKSVAFIVCRSPSSLAPLVKSNVKPSISNSVHVIILLVNVGSAYNVIIPIVFPLRFTVPALIIRKFNEVYVPVDNVTLFAYMLVAVPEIENEVVPKSRLLK